MDYIITETITHYHKFSTEDDADMERVIALAQRNLTDGGYNAVDRKYRWRYNVM